MKKILILTIVITSFLASCSDDWFTILPKGEASFETLFNKEGVEVLLIGAYADIDGVMRGGTSGQYSQGWSSTISNWVWGSVRADDAYKGSNYGDQSLINDIAGHFVRPENRYVNGHWQYMYDGILRANNVLTAIANADDMSAAEVAEATAEARFLRAHFYVEQTIVHGKVPWIDETTEKPNLVPNDHFVWPEIEADMQFAVNNLPETQADKGRPTKWAAKTYLARIYLHQGKYADAMPVLRDVYDNGPFSLVPQFNWNYLIAHNNNSESIFEIQYSVNSGFSAYLANYGDALNACSFKSISNFHQPSHNLVAAYRVDANGLPLEPDPMDYDITDILPYDKLGLTVPYTDPVDPRLDWAVARPGVPDYDWGIPNDSWIRNPVNGGPYMFKKSTFLKSEHLVYSSTSGRPGANANNFRKFKLGHVILWLAECEAEVGSLANATALVNEIRNRAKNSEVVRFDDGTPAANYLVEPYPADFATQDEARLAIRREERLEFCGEGNRFFDLVRWGIAAEVLNQYLSVDSQVMPHLQGLTGFVKGQHEYAPIPLVQMDLTKDDAGNPVLTQNPGY